MDIFCILQCMVKLEGDVMTEEQKAGDVTVVITRQVVGGELVSVRISKYLYYEAH